MKCIKLTHGRRVWAGLGLASLALGLAATPAHADVRREGQWPDKSEPVTLSLSEVPRTQAVVQLAQAVGWSVLSSQVGTAPVSIHVKDQPADKVLDFILSDGTYAAHRDGSMVRITRAEVSRDGSSSTPEQSAGTSPQVVPSATHAPELDSGASPGASSEPTGKVIAPRSGKDRSVFGGRLRIEKSEVVRDVNVLGGKLEVWGTVTGDLSVLGGNAHLHEGAHVMGDASTMGGNLTLDDGSRVDGELMAVGGNIKRSKGAIIGQGVTTKGGNDVVAPTSGHDHDEDTDKDTGSGTTSDRTDDSWFKRFGNGLWTALSRASLLFVLGAVLQALMTERVNMLKREVALRPMRSFALGMVGIASAVVLAIALCVTILGIPVALVGTVLGVIGIYAGVCAVLSLAGGLVLAGRTRNVYAHLALGCVLLFVLGTIPWMGTALMVVVTLLGAGALVATRMAGFVPPRGGSAPVQRE